MKIKFKDWFKVDLALYDEIHKSLGKDILKAMINI